MATRSVILSDLSSAELTDETHVTAIVRHPDVSFPVRLDMSSEEADKLADTTLRLMEFELHAPNQPTKTVRVETKVLDKLFNGVNWDDVIASAPKAEQPKTAAAPTRRAAAPKSASDKINYATLEHCGELHRGRITDEESRLVRENPDRASANRQAQGHPAIDWNDPKEKARYGL